MRTTPIKIHAAKNIELFQPHGLEVKGNDEAVCFYIELHESATALADIPMLGDNTPSIYLEKEYDEKSYMILSFPEFPGWDVHAVGSGKVINVALVKC